MLMFPLRLIIDKGLREQEKNIERHLPVILTMPQWAKKAVDRGFIMSYKAICDNCNGNGHINITDSKGKTEPKQCWICESQGEIKYEESFINKLINDHHHRLQ